MRSSLQVRERVGQHLDVGPTLPAGADDRRGRRARHGEQLDGQADGGGGAQPGDRITVERAQEPTPVSNSTLTNVNTPSLVAYTLPPL